MTEGRRAEIARAAERRRAREASLRKPPERSYDATFDPDRIPQARWGQEPSYSVDVRAPELLDLPNTRRVDGDGGKSDR